ncbi:carboxymuconolactone decarboxylase family protein [Novosphingobium jiangmenense]|uniref:Carboxymuconolactone decarboxylase family protein n=1 Tax=Novosphingobium jiangmenense TaxID=2791981 RepID=A0ABS0HCA2_9SPHN|nr:carboxymuconolactone decarboxylase family protein [Novosphingobium jiangmenense]MBF9149630.1 carboxymuconolactone decarboxylase family protein [Novosphingobium jiangmenense]
MDQDQFRRGLARRKEVLGDAYVDKALAAADDFTRPMQELTTGWCWGEVWSRPGLAARDRSLLNLGMISALNRPNELRLHVKAAFRNGLTCEEIREALLQVAVYCGVPAGMDSTRIAAEAIREFALENHGARAGAEDDGAGSR